ncbi:hypothetical protein Tco_0305047 [Tanacetum coccineum]
MANLKFADTHNMVAFLAKPAECEGFEQIVDFLNANPIRYALTINPTIYTSCVEQFWATVKAKTVNGEVQLQALVDEKKIIITESIVRRDLQLEDAEGVDWLPNATIFEQLTLMASKTTAWNEFSSTMASAIICLATNQKFNFSKYIFESMVKNLDNAGKFLMYPRLVPSCFVIFDLEPLSLSFDFVFTSEIFKSLSFSLDRLCHLAILCLDQHTHTLHLLESLLTISLDRLDILKEDLVYQSLRKSLSLILELY